jgi:sterol desaturase/sphingolipid hydroxylase (fatty acid hydroxylase superfamily)
MDLPDLLQLATPIVLALIFVEMLFFRLTHRGGFEPHDTATTLLMAFADVVISAALAFLFLAFNVWVANRRLFDLGSSWLVFVGAFVLCDLAFYCWHRANHRVRLLWADHVQHHSSQFFNLSTALRVSATGSIIYTLFFYMPMLLLGFPLGILIFTRGITTVYQFWIHTEAIGKCPGWFEAVMNTPSHHRVHHAANARYLDANYGAVFIVWDKLFGTFVAESAEDPPRFGLVKNLGTFNPVKVVLHEWVSMFRDLLRARSPRDVAGILFAPPGWQPNGNHETSEAIKAKWEKAGAGPAPGGYRSLPRSYGQLS